MMMMMMMIAPTGLWRWRCVRLCTRLATNRQSERQVVAVVVIVVHSLKHSYKLQVNKRRSESTIKSYFDDMRPPKLVPGFQRLLICLARRLSICGTRQLRNPSKYMYVHYMRLDLFLISNYVLYITAIKQKTISLALILSKM